VFALLRSLVLRHEAKHITDTHEYAVPWLPIATRVDISWSWTTTPLVKIDRFPIIPNTTGVRSIDSRVWSVTRPRLYILCRQLIARIIAYKKAVCRPVSHRAIYYFNALTISLAGREPATQ